MKKISNHGHSEEGGKSKSAFGDFAGISPHQSAGQQLGRWPANIIHDGSDEVLAGFPHTKSGTHDGHKKGIQQDVFGKYGAGQFAPSIGDEGSSARFFYTAKADAHDRAGSRHPTVKPLDLMQWLCRLITPKGGLILDPFAGSGTTGEAAWREGFSCHLVEREADYRADIARRMALASTSFETRKRESAKAKQRGPIDLGPLFGGTDTPPVTGEPSMASLPMKTASGEGNK